MNKHRILVVDDEKLSVSLYREILEAEGFEVFTAGNGVECLEIAKKHKPDLILLDMKMPEMDGAQTLLKLREDPEMKDVKVVFLTAFGDPLTDVGDIGFAKGEGATDYIRKGIGKDELTARVKNYLPD
jgi:CheY-like chemotaxis protein